MLSFISIAIFTLFSYNVAKERFVQGDFDTTVKIQDRIPQKYDDNFSILSLLGSVEVTFAIVLIMIFLAFLRLRWLSVLGWLMIIPATTAEIFGKLALYHPGPPLFFHRTTVFTHLPSFYVHTEFSYPSGHMVRTTFITTLFMVVILFSRAPFLVKFVLISALLGLTFLMGLSRISLGEHWLSDVVGGMLLGMGAGFFSCILILGQKRLPAMILQT